MIQGGANTDNVHMAPIFDAVAPLAPIPGMGNPGTNPLTFANMLPADYDKKFYTYAGSLTTPPCLQQVGVAPP